MSDFEEGDLVAVVGGTLDQAQQYTRNVTLCHVYAVGEEDLLVKEDTRHYPTLFKVSKKLCTRVGVDPELLMVSQPLKPQLGDLVMSYPSTRFADKDTEPYTGILYEITMAHGKPSSCKLLYDNALQDASYNTLIVLQKAIPNVKK